MPDRKISRFLIKSGGFFGLWENLDPARNEFAKWTWSLSSGARTIYLLPKISNSKGHKKLRQRYGLTTHAPHDWRNHWETFVEIANSKSLDNKWHNEFIFFSDKWFDTAIKDPAWKEFIDYMRNCAWIESNYWRNKMTFELFWEEFLHEMMHCNVKASLYVSLIAKQLILTGIGIVPGFCIANGDLSFAPLNQLIKAYTQDYKIEYAPLFMAPHILSLDDTNPTYYSLQYPNLLETVPISNKLPEGVFSALTEVAELLDMFRNKFAPERVIEGSPIDLFCKQINLHYFHSIEKKAYNIFSTNKIPELDGHISTLINESQKNRDNFPSSSIFLKGCVLLSKKTV